MLAGHLAKKNGMYYAVVNCKHRDESRYPKWVKTDLPVKKGYKMQANEMLLKIRGEYTVYGELIADVEAREAATAESSIPLDRAQPADEKPPKGDILFADYMLSWLSYMETEVDPLTYAGYCDSVEKHIYPYFMNLGVTLSELEPSHLRDFYKFERKGDPQAGKKAKKGTTVVRYHANIHSALEAALTDGAVGKNVAHRQHPKTDKYIGSFYSPDEAIECMKAAEEQAGAGRYVRVVLRAAPERDRRPQMAELRFGEQHLYHLSYGYTVP